MKLENLSALFENGAYTLVLQKDGETIYKDFGRGVGPALRVYDTQPELLRGAEVCDTIVGKAAAAIYVFAVLFYVAKLFRDFRHWEINPAIGDYCFSLFAMISFMLASYYAGAFSFDRGARRRLSFFSLTGVLFGAISLAGAGLSELLIYAGSLFWMLACAQQMMKKP